MTAPLLDWYARAYGVSAEEARRLAYSDFAEYAWGVDHSSPEVFAAWLVRDDSISNMRAWYDVSSPGFSSAFSDATLLDLIQLDRANRGELFGTGVAYTSYVYRAPTLDELRYDELSRQMEDRSFWVATGRPASIAYAATVGAGFLAASALAGVSAADAIAEEVGAGYFLSAEAGAGVGIAAETGLVDVAVAAGGVGAATIPAAAEVAIAGGAVAAAAPASAFTLAGIGQALGQSAVGAAIKNLVAPSPAKLAPVTAVAAAEAPAPTSPLGMLALLGVLAFVIS
jgi:hypothetical protein